MQKFEDVFPLEVDSLIQQALEDLKQSQQESQADKKKKGQASQPQKGDKTKASGQDRREQVHQQSHHLAGQDSTPADQALSAAGLIKSPNEYLGEG